MSERAGIRARRLLGVTVRARDGVRSAVAVFPMFDRNGQVRTVMLVRRRAGRILLLDQAPDRFSAGRRGFVTVDAEWPELEEADAAKAAACGELWHFDPIWVLDSGPLPSHPATPALRGTNAAGRFLDPVRRVVFSPDLSFATEVVLEGSGKRVPFGAHLLPIRGREPASSCRRRPGGWRLAGPFRWAGPRRPSTRSER